MSSSTYKVKFNFFILICFVIMVKMTGAQNNNDVDMCGCDNKIKPCICCYSCNRCKSDEDPRKAHVEFPQCLADERPVACFKKTIHGSTVDVQRGCLREFFGPYFSQGAPSYNSSEFTELEENVKSDGNVEFVQTRWYVCGGTRCNRGRSRFEGPSMITLFGLAVIPFIMRAMI